MHYQLLPDRVLWAVVAGAATGGALTALIGGPLFPIVALVAFVVWAIGLLTVGLPLWALLEALGLRRPWIAVMLGAASAAGVAWLVFFRAEGMGWQPLGFTALMGAAGAIVAVVCWRTAYRRSPAP